MPLIFSVSGFASSDVPNIRIFIILYDLCLLPTQFRYVLINLWNLERDVALEDCCAPWKFTNGAENLVLQTLQIPKWEKRKSLLI
jgi:hypothetical protein